MAGAKKVVDFEGVSIEVDPAVLTTWKFARLSAIAGNDALSDTEKFPAVMELVSFVMGDSLSALVEHLGGDAAQLDDVMAAFTKVMEEAAPKA